MKRHSDTDLLKEELKNLLDNQEYLKAKVLLLKSLKGKGYTSLSYYYKAVDSRTFEQEEYIVMRFSIWKTFLNLTLSLIFIVLPTVGLLNNVGSTWILIGVLIFPVICAYLFIRRLLNPESHHIKLNKDFLIYANQEEKYRLKWHDLIVGFIKSEPDGRHTSRIFLILFKKDSTEELVLELESLNKSYDEIASLVYQFIKHNNPDLHIP